MPDVIAMTGLSIATIYRLIKVGSFPQPRSIGGGMIGFIVVEIERWILDRPVAVIGTRAERLRRPSRLVSAPDQAVEATPAASALIPQIDSPSPVATPMLARRVGTMDVLTDLATLPSDAA